MTSGSGVSLVDTNVLVYAYDPADPAKRERAIAVVEHLASTRSGALTAQILGEFFVTVTRKITPPLTSVEAERSVANYLRSWQVYGVTPADVGQAVRCTRRHGFSYWDALIWAVAKRRGVGTILSEDFTDGARVEGVRFINPFTARFELSILA
ncbi:MAG: PIN domain-containing protein [Dehalococcoidia bacterium]